MWWVKQMIKYRVINILWRMESENSVKPNYFLSFFFGGLGTGGWTWGLTLTRQVLYHLSHSTSSVYFGSFWDRALFYYWVSNPPICNSLNIWDTMPCQLIQPLENTLFGIEIMKYKLTGIILMYFWFYVIFIYSSIYINLNFINF
jgi:hypothetical protein